VSSDNIVRHLVAAGKTWKAYAKILPSAGDVTLDLDNGSYASRHNPLVYLTGRPRRRGAGPARGAFTQFASDLSNSTLPNYSFIVPNLCNDAHDCSLGTAGRVAFKGNIDPLVRSTQFQQDGLLLILFDESGATTPTEAAGSCGLW